MNAKKHATQDSLPARMRREADQQSPEHSAFLHARIMRGIAQAPAPVPAAPRYSLRWPFAAAAAAAIALVLTLHHGKSHDPISKPESVVINHPIPPLPSMNSAIASLTQPAAQTFDQARYAYLDRDAESLAHYVIEQMDVSPPAR